MKQHRALPVVLALAVIVVLRVLGGYIFNLVALPDLCDYHNKDVQSSWLFDLFFPMSAANGYHPGPGMFFYLFIIFFGISAGIWFKRKQDGAISDPSRLTV